MLVLPELNALMGVWPEELTVEADVRDMSGIWVPADHQVLPQSLSIFCIACIFIGCCHFAVTLTNLGHCQLRHAYQRLSVTHNLRQVEKSLRAAACQDLHT